MCCVVENIHSLRVACAAGEILAILAGVASNSIDRLKAAKATMLIRRFGLLVAIIKLQPSSQAHAKNERPSQNQPAPARNTEMHAFIVKYFKIYYSVSF